MDTQYAGPLMVARAPAVPSAAGRRHCLVDGDPHAVVVGYSVLGRRSPCLDHLPATDGPWAGQPVDAGDCELCATDQRTVLLHLKPQATAVGLHYTAGTIAVPDQLIGTTLTQARQLLRDLDVAYIQQLLDS